MGCWNVCKGGCFQQQDDHARHVAKLPNRVPDYISPTLTSMDGVGNTNLIKR